MTLLDIYRKRSRSRDAENTPGEKLGLIRRLRESIQKRAHAQSAAAEVLSDLNHYERLMQAIAPLSQVAETAGYQQWRADVMARLDTDLQRWPEQYLEWVAQGRKAEELMAAAAVFAATQVFGRRQWALIEHAREEQERYQRFQEKSKTDVS